MDRTIYVKCDAHAVVEQSRVFLKDVAEVYCAEPGTKRAAEEVVVAELGRQGERKVISVLYIMERLQEVLPRVGVVNLGETDVILDWEKSPRGEIFKVLFVCLIAFFGTAFTIMAFHNDVDIRGVFEEVYRLTGEMPPGEASSEMATVKSEGATAGDSSPMGVLEISYCLGLFLGITVFFNHLGRKMLSNDPTPIAVAMHNYEKDVNQTIVENAERRGLEESE